MGNARYTDSSDAIGRSMGELIAEELSSEDPQDWVGDIRVRSTRTAEMDAASIMFKAALENNDADDIRQKATELCAAITRLTWAYGEL
jgi:gluconate kinase